MPRFGKYLLCATRRITGYPNQITQHEAAKLNGLEMSTVHRYYCEPAKRFHVLYTGLCLCPRGQPGETWACRGPMDAGRPPTAALGPGPPSGRLPCPYIWQWHRQAWLMMSHTCTLISYLAVLLVFLHALPTF